MLSGAWQVATELCGTIFYADGARGIVLVSNTFRDANSGDAPLAHFSGSYRLEEENHYGLRMTTKPLPRDHIGHPVARPPDNMGVAHFGVRDANGLGPLVVVLPE